MSLKNAMKELFGSKKELTSENFGKLIDSSILFEPSELKGGGHKLEDERIHIAVSKKWVASEGHLSDAIRLQWTADRAKPAIVWVNENGDDKTAIISHDMANNPSSPDHRHLSIETTNGDSPELHTRMEFPYDANVCEIQVHQSNFTVNGTSRIGGEKGMNRRLIFTTNASKKDNLDVNGTPIYDKVYVPRFAFGISSHTESGDNSGSNFEIVRYSDMGVALDNSMAIDRKTNNVGFRTRTPESPLDVNADRIRIRIDKTPKAATDTGLKGEICWDDNFIYICTATNTWKRTAIEMW